MKPTLPFHDERLLTDARTWLLSAVRHGASASLPTQFHYWYVSRLGHDVSHAQSTGIFLDLTRELRIKVWLVGNDFVYLSETKGTPS